MKNLKLLSAFLFVLFIFTSNVNAKTVVVPISNSGIQTMNCDGNTIVLEGSNVGSFLIHYNKLGRIVWRKWVFEGEYTDLATGEVFKVSWNNSFTGEYSDWYTTPTKLVQKWSMVGSEGTTLSTKTTLRWDGPFLGMEIKMDCE